jgi:hypothetical protein
MRGIAPAIIPKIDPNTGGLIIRSNVLRHLSSEDSATLPFDSSDKMAGPKIQKSGDLREKERERFQFTNKAQAIISKLKLS